jgi:tetratricopeptide (TPR) repeat protein
MTPADDSGSETPNRRQAKGVKRSARPGKPVGRDQIAVARRDGPGGAGWEIVQARCARRRREDIEEVEAMIAAGEAEIARDELVWLLSECPDFLEAHVHLGLIALEEGDAKLARGHFGRAYELCLRAIEAAGNPKPLPHALAGNQPFYEAAKGLVHCLLATGRKKLAGDTCKRIAPLDPADPLGIQKLPKR